MKKTYCPSDELNVKALRKQQLRLGLLKAAQTLLLQQNALRQVLSQPTIVTTDAEGGGASCPDDDGDTAGPVFLMQHLMQVATQPSPVKAIFTREELEVCSSCLYSCCF